MKTKRLDFNYRSLTMSTDLEVVGVIPPRQSYDAVSGEYAPDYTIEGSHLVLQPHVFVMDDEPGVERGEVTASSFLTNIVWTEITESGSTVITTSNTDYEITLSGDNKGRLTVKRNFTASQTATLEYTADYLDARSNETHHIRLTQRVACDAETTLPTISIDKPTTNLWNPFRDPDTMTFNCHLKYDDLEVAVADRTFIWEKRRSDGSWSAIGADEGDDFGWSVTNDGATYTQQMKTIGEKQDMRVRAIFGDITGVNEALTVYFTIVRRLPDFDYDYTDVADQIEQGTEYVYPTVKVTDREGVVTNALDFLEAEWYTAAGTSGTTPTMELYATTPNPAISTAQINQNGMILGLKLVDKGNHAKVMEDGAYVVEGGKIVIS